MRLVYLLLGAVSLALGIVGAFLPLLPTVPFILLAAWFFARGHPPVEAWLLRHPDFGPHIVSWRERGAIGRGAKRAAYAAFGLSAVLALVLMPLPWSLIPLAVAIIGASWIRSRPES